MKSWFISSLAASIVFGLMFFGSADRADAVPPFFKQFNEKYVKNATDDKAKALATLVANSETGKCFVCHIKGKKKKERNAYGQELSKLLDKKNFSKARLKKEAEKANQEILAALEKVAALPSDAKDKKSPTFGALLAQGKLPAAPVAKAPAKEEKKPTDAKPVEEKKVEPKPKVKAPAPASEVELLSALFATLKSKIKAELKAELVQELEAVIETKLSTKFKPELKAELKDILKSVVKAEMNAEMRTYDPKLEEIAIAAITKIGGTVSAIAQNDDSKEVDFHLGGTALTDEGLAQLEALSKLVHLHLKDTQITDQGLASIASITTLKRLHLEKTKISDSGLVHLKGLDNISYLNLYGTTVTDVGLEHLKGMTNLKKLYLWQSQVTEEGVKKLRIALPNCEIVWNLSN